MRLAVQALAAMIAAALPLCGAVRAEKIAQPVGVMPFRYVHHELVAQVRVNGYGPYAMLLDTGTSPSIIDLSVARQIGLKIAATGQGGSGGGTSPAANLAYETTLPRVELGSMRAADIPALAMDLSGLSRKFGAPIQGVLGDSLFSGRVVQFDYPARVARFYLRSPFGARPPGRLAAVLPFSHEEEVHLSGVRVDGQPVSANLDTGSNSEFQLTPRAVRKLGLAGAASRATVSKAAGFNGAYATRSGRIESVQIGAIRVASPQVTFWQTGTGHDDRPWDINIGNVFWQNYIVTIDYQKDVVTLQRPDPIRAPAHLP